MSAPAFGGPTIENSQVTTTFGSTQVAYGTPNDRN